MPAVAKHAWPAGALVPGHGLHRLAAVSWHCLGAGNACPPLHPTCRRRRRTRTCTTTCLSPSCTTRCAPLATLQWPHWLRCIGLCQPPAVRASACCGCCCWAHPARCTLAAPHPCTTLIGSSPIKLQDAETDLARIVGFEVEPHSIAHKYDGKHRLYAHALPPTCFMAALCRCMIDPTGWRQCGVSGVPGRGAARPGCFACWCSPPLPGPQPLQASGRARTRS